PEVMLIRAPRASARRIEQFIAEDLSAGVCACVRIAKSPLALAGDAAAAADRGGMDVGEDLKPHGVLVGHRGLHDAAEEDLVMLLPRFRIAPISADLRLRALDFVGQIDPVRAEQGGHVLDDDLHAVRLPRDRLLDRAALAQVAFVRRAVDHEVGRREVVKPRRHRHARQGQFERRMLFDEYLPRAREFEQIEQVVAEWSGHYIMLNFCPWRNAPMITRRPPSVLAPRATMRSASSSVMFNSIESIRITRSPPSVTRPPCAKA